MSQSVDFHNLNPQDVMTAAEAAGFDPTGEFQQLNSYENRVFDLTLERNDEPTYPHVISKFYRPGRWTVDQIAEEHEFLAELATDGIAVGLAHSVDFQNTQLNTNISSPRPTILNFNGLYASFFKKVQGRMPDEFIGDQLKQIGRLLAHVHNIGARKKFAHRCYLNQGAIEGYRSLDLVMSRVAPEVSQRYEEAAQIILDYLDENLEPHRYIRIHGDCHRGNLLHISTRSQVGAEQTPTNSFYLVDFDDSMMGPEVQDFWMLFSGMQSESREEEDLLISGYEELREFPFDDLHLVEPLRGLRIINYAAWIINRWSDPSFKKIFSEFGSYQYWAEETEALEKIAWTLS